LLTTTRQPAEVVAARDAEDAVLPGEPSGSDAGPGPDAARGPRFPAALPVALEVRGQRSEALRRTIEGVLGWQLVDDLTASLVPPALRLADVTATRRDGTPVVLLVGAEDDPRVAAEATFRLRPAAVVGWPATDEHLVAAASRAAAAPRTAAAVTATVRVGGAGGGVGTTTVASALAGLAAWRGATVLLASGDAVLLPPGAPAIEPAALAAPDLFVRAAAVRGVVGARAVRTTGPVLDVALTDPTVGVAVLDVGVADEADVLVLRPDAAGLAALERTSAAAVVVTGAGPVPTRALAAAVGGRRRVDAPWSHRVARAALVGRVPAALPGSYVRALAGLVPTDPRTADVPGPSG
jgi:hypothetical protein